jgi:glucose-6-phosphate 1-dehydrogenase
VNSTVPERLTVVIFGGAGDLAHRKLLPALYNLRLDGLLPPRIAVVGCGRKPMADEEFRALARDGIRRYSRRPLDEAQWEQFSKALFFAAADASDPTSLASLGARLDTVEHELELGGEPRIYYLALPPSMIEPTVRSLARARFVGHRAGGPGARVIVEKPIGHDLASSRAINDAIAEVFDEPEIFRIDHYLGKETVQNILVLRFANSFLEPLFNAKYVDHVQITVAERDGVGTRASYYEQAGALRDMVQNHLLQLLTLVAMEPPFSLDAEAVRDEKLQVLQSLRPIEGTAVDHDTVRGQYSAGSIDGERVRGYLEEDGVPPGSRTEAFVALQVAVDNWRWAGVPFFLRTGKRLARRASEIAVQLKSVPPILFNRDRSHPLESNVLVLRLQPDEGFALHISSKRPGSKVDIRPVEMDFEYAREFGRTSPEAYERLLLDVMAGDSTLFMRRDSVEASWRFITPILERWAELGAPLPSYGAGTWGPAEAERLVEATGRTWRAPPIV